MSALSNFSSNLLYGGIAGIIATTTVFPLDTVKTRLQNQRGVGVGSGKGGQYTGVIDCFRKIIRGEGARGLYRGLMPNLVGVTPEKAIKLSANDLFRALYGQWYFGSEEEAKKHELPIWIGALAGGSAGFCQVIATNPMEITKIRMQLQAQLPADQVRKSAIGVVKELGLSGMYRGTVATLSRDVPFSMLYFSMFAKFKDMQRAEDGSLPFSRVFLSAICAGSISSALVTPADVVKTRLQAGSGKEYAGLWDCAVRIYQKEGVPALFKGVIPRVLIISPLFGITMFVYEVQQQMMRKQQA